MNSPERPGGVDEEPGSFEGVHGTGIGAIRRQAGVELRSLLRQPVQEGPIQLAQAVLAVEVLVVKPGLAEREVPPGGR